jgi:hypothetical protein
MTSYDDATMGNGFGRPRRTPRPAALSLLLAAAAMVAVIAAGTGSAQGSSASTLKLTVCAPCGIPIAIGPGHKFKVQASGTSSSASKLSVFNVSPPCSIGFGCNSGAPKCAKSASAEGKLHYSHTRQIVSTNVNHGFRKSATALASEHQGTGYECAYITSGTRTLAHVSVLYSIVKGGY